MPHHSIFIYKAGKLSYLDVCFLCREYNASADLGDIPPFDNRRWDELKKFYAKLGLDYMLNDLTGE